MPSILEQFHIDHENRVERTLEQILHLLRERLPKPEPPRYTLSVQFNLGENMFTPKQITEPSLVVGQSVVGVVTETETLSGVTSPVTIVSANITALPATAGIVTASVDPSTGNITITAVAAGTVNVVVSDTVNAAAGATATYQFTVTEAAPTFAINVAFGTPTP